MAKVPSFQKSFSGLMTLILTIVLIAPGTWLASTPSAFAADYSVTTNADSGAGSLRQAITDANGNVGPDNILIDSSLAGATISLLSDLPAITEDVVIDGTAASPALTLTPAAGGNYGLYFNTGAPNNNCTVEGLTVSGDTLQGGILVNSGHIQIGSTGGSGGVTVTGSVNSASGGIVLTGGNVNVNNSVIKSNYVGIKVASGNVGLTVGNDQSTINVIRSNTADGISIDPSADIGTLIISHNYIGLKADGTVSANGGNGITIGSHVDTGTISNNFISGNTDYGILTDGTAITITGNSIGTNVSGTAAIPNGLYGVALRGDNNTVGGTSTAERNTISGNTSGGILIDGTLGSATGNTVEYNNIGTNALGTAAIANAVGITIDNGAQGNTIGGTSVHNLISGNTGDGIYITGATSTANSIQGNHIGISEDAASDIPNGGNGIDLESDQTTIGTAGIPGDINVVSGNTAYGILLNGADQTVIVNNNIGTSADGTTLDANGSNAIEIEGTSQSNNIGGSAAGATNKIGASVGNINIHVANTAGNFNKFASNDFQSPAVASTAYATVDGTANEGISAPTLTGGLQITTTLHVSGTAPASSSVDFYVDGALVSGGTATADGSGNYTAALTSSGGTYVTAIATNGTNSSSASSSHFTITTDTTAPDAPVLSYASSAAAGSTAVISGSGTEAAAEVYVNSVDSGVVVAGDGTFSVSETLVAGTNTFDFVITDPSANSSTMTEAVITGTTTAAVSSGGAGTSVQAGAAGHGNDNSLNHGTTNPIPTETQAPESMAGDTEVVSPVVTPTPTATPTAPTVAPTEPTTSVPSNSTKTSSKAPSVSTGTHHFVQAIKPVSIRDTMPAHPARNAAYTDALLHSPALGQMMAGNIPSKLIELRLGNVNADLNADKDGDGLTNGEEILYGSDPNVKDGDGDGISDFQEIEFDGTDPASWDSDHDMIPDSKDAEPLVYNDPTATLSAKTLTDYISQNTLTEAIGVVDSDQDGLSDEVELAIGTDPHSIDSDADGLTDGDEITHLGSDPKNPTAAGVGGVLRLANVSKKETVAEGQQFFMGSADANSTVGLYEIADDGTLSLLGQNQADSAGRFTIFTDKNLTPGTHTLVAIQGSPDDLQDISPSFDLNVQDVVKRPEYVSLGLQDGSTITDHQPQIDLQASKHTLITISWRSTVFSQVLIADADNQVVYAKPAEPLENGAHTVTWYAQDLSTDQKSSPTRVSFNVTNEAFVSGQQGSGSSPWTLIFGSLAVLASLAAIGLYFRRKKLPHA